MEQDLTASVWDDVIAPRNGSSSFNLDSSAPPTNDFANLDPFRSDNDGEDEEEEEDERIEGTQHSEGDSQSEDQYHNDQYQSHSEDQHDQHQHQHKQHARKASDYQNEQMLDLKKEHTQQLLSELTNDSNGTFDEAVISPKRVSASESLFNVKDSPIKLSPSLETTTTLPKPAQSSNGKRVLSVKNTSKYRTNPRPRKFSSKTVVTHLGGDDTSKEKTESYDPLSFEPLGDTESDAVKTASKTDTLLQETEGPLYEITPRKKRTKEETLRELAKPTGEAIPRPSEAHPKLDIVVGDPLKVGDITNAYIVYSIRTRTSSDTEHFPKEAVVSRRYKDFRWIYGQLQQNHPGRIIPPPPSKQTYIGRFNENFIENRRLSLEKMLTKMSNISILCNDPDFSMFLTSQDFVVDSKDRENDMGASMMDSEHSSAAATAAAAAAAAAADASAAAGASGGFMSLFSIANKLADPDEYFVQKKQYIDELEVNLRQLYKSLELIGTQRLELIGVLEEISVTLDELSALEISKVTSDLLLAFSEVQLKLKENLDRINLQDQLTLGFTIEEYLRIIGSINHVLDTRLKVYQQYQTFSSELSKKQQQYDKLNKKYGAAPNDKISGLQFEIGKLKSKSSNYESSYENISSVIKEEIANFEFEKIEDFRNSVEIFIESSIESQKEAIELYETFFERQNLAAV